MYNKFIKKDGEVLLDLTDDSISASDLLEGVTAHNKSGEKITGTIAFQPAKTIRPGTTNQIAVSSGYYTGGNITVQGDANLVADNIKSGVSIFGVSGTYAGNGGDTSMEDGMIARTATTYINSGATAVGNYAFYSYGGLTTVSFADAKTIGNSAFYCCSGLTTANFPAVTSINASAFYFCSGLTTISFPIATTIGSFAFQYCSRLTTANFPAVKTIDSAAFYYCSGLTSASFPVCTTIGNSAFHTCSGLTSVSFPVCTYISNYAFLGCSGLTSVSFPACTSIGTSAFARCSSLTSVSFPVCTYISIYAFQSCSGLTSASFPVCTTIGTSAFAYCSGLTTANFPAVTKINPSAFACCFSLTSASFPACTTIGSSAFAYCSGLTTASFPAAAYINGYAFASCSSLTSVSFPVCTYITSYAFAYCFNLKSLYLTGSSLCKLSNSNAFTSTPIGGYSTSAGTYGSIYVPASLLTQYQTATNWAYFSSRFVAIEDDAPGGVITFTIGKTTYEAVDGMTWSEFIESEYNTYPLTTYQTFVLCQLHGDEVLTDANGAFVQPTDIIMANSQYKMTQYAAYNGESASIGNFYIDDVCYHMDRNLRAGTCMTWQEWVNSTYNVDNYSIDEYNNNIMIVIHYDDGSSAGHCVATTDGSIVSPSNTIVDGGQYVLWFNGEGNEEIM